MKRSTPAAIPAKEAAGPRYLFRLYVSGSTPRSTKAIRNIRKICEENLTGRYDLEVVDIYQQPGLAGEQQIIAAPTLIKALPLPLRRFIGDLSHSERVLAGIGLRPATGGAPA
jgi:circadian clock protein KaiB